MKKWLRRILIAALLVGLTFGVLYECATHVGRGWLCGEAFYEGRPTSYWRWRIDTWKATFATIDEALDAIGPTDGFPDGLVVFLKYRVKTRTPVPLWERVQAWVIPKQAPRGSFPEILDGWTDGAEDVFRELEQDPAYRPFIQRRRLNQRTW